MHNSHTLSCYENRHRSTPTVIPAEAGIHLQCLAISPSKNGGTNTIFIPGGEGGNPHEVFRTQRSQESKICVLQPEPRSRSGRDDGTEPDLTCKNTWSIIEHGLQIARSSVWQG